jgi:hypothetical protein
MKQVRDKDCNFSRGQGDVEPLEQTALGLWCSGEMYTRLRRRLRSEEQTSEALLVAWMRA